MRTSPRVNRLFVRKSVPVAVAVALVAALLITLLSGVPRPLPGIALGSEPLFYIERGVAAFAIFVIATSLLARGLRGELPSQLSTSGISYPEKLEQAVGSSDLAITMLAARVDRLDADMKKRDELLRLLVSHVVDLDTRIERGEDADRPSEGR
jgi:hypothetical protein